jgi:hypothetical protein
MNPLTLGKHIQLGSHERAAIHKRLEQIEVALDHPRLTAHQATALRREQAELARKLAEPSEE